MKVHKPLLGSALGLIMIAATALCSLPAQAQGRYDLITASLDRGAQHVPGELLVQFRPAVAAGLRQAALARVGAHTVEDVDGEDGPGGLYLVKLPKGISIRAALARLQADPAIKFAEPNWTVTPQAIYDDHYYASGELWGMYGDASPTHTNPYGSQAAEAWAQDKLCSKDVHVAIIDTGVMPDHEDLAPNIWVNPFDPIDGIDNDGNGMVDDVHGWDFLHKDNSTFDGLEDEHGTHIAGIIGAVGGNTVGVVGICQAVTIITAKFKAGARAPIARAIKAINYITKLKKLHGLNIVAINASWTTTAYSATLEDAIKRSTDQGILFVTAAGNGYFNIDTDQPHYPALYTNPGIIVATAITNNGARESSNYGKWSVDLGAPGYAIMSTVPLEGGGSGYTVKEGTSMATAYVTGAVALYASLHPGATAAEIKAAILEGAAATPTEKLIGRTVTGGRLNLSGF